MSESSKIPDAFLDPMTHEVMRDPVTLEDGHSYDKASIQEWFRRGNHTSPITNLTVNCTTMIPNVTLKKAIEEMTEVHPTDYKTKLSQQNEVLALRITLDVVEERIRQMNGKTGMRGLD